MSQIEITKVASSIFQKFKEEEKEKFIEDIMQRQLNLIEEFGTYGIEKEVVIDFIKKINVAKVKERLWGGWFISGYGWEDDRGWVLSYSLFFLLMFLSFVLACPVSFFKWSEHDSSCVCFLVYYLFSLSLVSLTSTYWGIEIVVSVI